MRKKMLYTGAAISLFFAVLHAMFWKLGSWSTQLPKLTPDNSGIMQMLTVVSIYTMLFGTGISLVLAKKQTFVFAEKAFVIFMAGYYLLRIAFGLPFFGFSAIEVSVWILCLLAAMSYLGALRQSQNGVAT